MYLERQRDCFGEGCDLVLKNYEWKLLLLPRVVVGRLFTPAPQLQFIAPQLHSVHCSTASPPANADPVHVDPHLSGAWGSGQMCSPEQTVKWGEKLIFFAMPDVKHWVGAQRELLGEAWCYCQHPPSEKVALSCPWSQQPAELGPCVGARAPGWGWRRSCHVPRAACHVPCASSSSPVPSVIPARPVLGSE